MPTLQLHSKRRLGWRLIGKRATLTVSGLRDHSSILVALEARWREGTEETLMVRGHTAATRILVVIIRVARQRAFLLVVCMAVARAELTTILLVEGWIRHVDSYVLRAGLALAPYFNE